MTDRCPSPSERSTTRELIGEHARRRACQLDRWSKSWPRVAERDVGAINTVLRSSSSSACTTNAGRTPFCSCPRTTARRRQHRTPFGSRSIWSERATRKLTLGRGIAYRSVKIDVRVLSDPAGRRSLASNCVISASTLYMPEPRSNGVSHRSTSRSSTRRGLWPLTTLGLREQSVCLGAILNDTGPRPGRPCCTCGRRQGDLQVRCPGRGHVQAPPRPGRQRDSARRDTAATARVPSPTRTAAAPAARDACTAARRQTLWTRARWESSASSACESSAAVRAARAADAPPPA